MTPKEKAKDLLEKFRGINPEPHHTLLRKRKAKLSALICVDEHIKDYTSSRLSHRIKYWEGVKQEIEKL